ncbi:hypothetical protein TNCT_142981 [Trichonephila clavata]|uniref:Uncharacterized protein n=1 Tax=Trichonephila clavata TaxID=2740835 RepID=A0A8X6FL00_TRICU|nr:hypothetical protein TNCT_142981 [Trichonephila clavata]
MLDRIIGERLEEAEAERQQLEHEAERQRLEREAEQQRLEREAEQRRLELNVAELRAQIELQRLEIRRLELQAAQQPRHPLEELRRFIIRSLWHKSRLSLMRRKMR